MAAIAANNNASVSISIHISLSTVTSQSILSRTHTGSALRVNLCKTKWSAYYNLKAILNIYLNVGFHAIPENEIHRPVPFDYSRGFCLCLDEKKEWDLVCLGTKWQLMKLAIYLMIVNVLLSMPSSVLQNEWAVSANNVIFSLCRLSCEQKCSSQMDLCLQKKEGKKRKKCGRPIRIEEWGT